MPKGYITKIFLKVDFNKKFPNLRTGKKLNPFLVEIL